MATDQDTFTRHIKGELGLLDKRQPNGSGNVVAFPGCKKPATSKSKPAPFLFSHACECAVRGHVMHKLVPLLEGSRARTTIAGELYRAIVEGAINRRLEGDVGLTAKEWREVVRVVGAEPPKSIHIDGVAYQRYKFRNLHPEWSDTEIEVNAKHMAKLRREAIDCLRNLNMKASART